jgi:1-acyl-sn-glycerol-3-phosphate acyltransferase
MRSDPIRGNAPPPARGAVSKVVEDTVGYLFKELHHAPPPAYLDPHSRLDTDLGFDSLARVELVARLEHALQIQFPPDRLGSLDTIADLLNIASAAADAHAPSSAVPAPLERPVSRIPGGQPSSAGTLVEVLTWQVAQHPDATHVIVLDDGDPKVLSYEALLAGAQRIASGLAQLGVSSGATVALMLPTSVDYLHAFLGVLLAGAVPVPLYRPAHQLEEHVRRHTGILCNAGTEVLIAFHEIELITRMLKSRAPRLRHVVSVAELKERGRTGQLPAGAVSADSIALLQYTSGSTGSPKGVVLTHAQLLANIRAMGASIDASNQDVFVSWLPLYHDMGLIGAWLGSLYFGCLLVLMSPTAFLARPSRWLRAIHDYRGTLTASPNFGYEFAARRPAEVELRGLDLSCLRISFNGAEPVYPETLERFRSRFAPYSLRPEALMPVYGLAEAGVGLTFPPPGCGPLLDRIDRESLALRGEARPTPEAPRSGTPDAMSLVSCGRPLPGYRLRIVDERGVEVAERVEGNLQFAGPSATDGYYRNPEATAHLLCGPWRNTGDRAYLARGELYLTSRAKDIIIRRGRHFYPHEIEAAVGEVDGVRRGCAVAFGTREAETGTERLIVVVETSETDPACRHELQARINGRVTSRVGEPPDEIVLAQPHAVLKTSSGKLRRAATRHAYLEGSLGRVPRSPASQMLRLALESAMLRARRGLEGATHVAFGLYAWCVLLTLAAPVLIFTMLLRSPAVTWRLNHVAARWAVQLLRMPLTMTCQAPVDPSGPHIVVANHSSYADSLFLAALLAERHRFVAKAELARVPALHHYLDRLGTVFIERFVPEQSAAEVGRVEEALRRGDSIVMFPEGTFTSTAGLRMFHLGAFEAAVAAGVPIIPLALHGTRSVFRGGQWFPRRSPVGAVVGAPLIAQADEQPFAAAIRLRDAARTHILRHCGEPDIG